MADTITSAYNLKLNYAFADGDTRIVTLPNPRDNLTEQDIDNVSATLRGTQAFVGDKAGAAFSSIISAMTVTTTRVHLDLS